MGHGTGAVKPLLSGRREIAALHNCCCRGILGTASFLGEDERDGEDASGQDYQRAVEALRQLRWENAAWREMIDFDCDREAILSWS